MGLAEVTTIFVQVLRAGTARAAIASAPPSSSCEGEAGRGRSTKTTIGQTGQRGGEGRWWWRRRKGGARRRQKRFGLRSIYSSRQRELTWKPIIVLQPSQSLAAKATSRSQEVVDCKHQRWVMHIR